MQSVITWAALVLESVMMAVRDIGYPYTSEIVYARSLRLVDPISKYFPSCSRHRLRHLVLRMDSMLCIDFAHLSVPRP